MWERPEARGFPVAGHAASCHRLPFDEGGAGYNVYFPLLRGGAGDNGQWGGWSRAFPKGTKAPLKMKGMCVLGAA